MTQEPPCPCGSGQPYSSCCGPFIEGASTPQTAEQLMRSRYSAYAMGNKGWLLETWHPATRRSNLELEDPVQWIGLKIVSTTAGGIEDSRGEVEFIARYKIHGRAHRLHERSQFQRREGRWFYVRGDLDPVPTGVNPAPRGQKT